MNRTFAVGGVLVLGLVAGLMLWSPWKQTPPTEQPFRKLDTPNIVFLTIDTLRADRLQVYGHDRNTSPNLVELSKRGIVFDQAIAQAPWTLPSLATLHTGLYPRQHGAIRYETRLSDDALTIAEAMKKQGYSTVGVVAHRPANRRHGFAQGFERFDETPIGNSRAITSEVATDVALEQLKHVDRNKPFFLWVHYFDPHSAYMRHPKYGYSDEYMKQRFPRSGIKSAGDLHEMLDPSLQGPFVNYALGVYDEEIAYTDSQIGRLVDALENLNAAANTVFIVTSDHGELFSEHGRFAHGRDTYEELVRVPLIVAGAIDPSLHGKVVKERVEIAAVPATIMVATEASERPFRGPDLLAVARGQATFPAVFTQGLMGGSAKFRKDTVYVGPHKLVYHHDGGHYELFNLEEDPTEETNIVSEPKNAELVAVLQKQIQGFRELDTTLTVPELHYEPDVIEQLKELGYLN